MTTPWPKSSWLLLVLTWMLVGSSFLWESADAARFFGKQPTLTTPLDTKGGSFIVKTRNVKAHNIKQQTPLPPPPPPKEEAAPPKRQTGPDSLAAFKADVSTVLNEIRADEYDPTVSRIYHTKLRPTFAVTWTHDMWEEHTSRWRFVNLFLYWHASALMKRIIPQLTGLMVWTFFAIRIVDHQRTVLSKINFPMTSLSLVSGFVASLLALRSNQGLSRLMEARQAFGKTVLYTRDMSSLVANFIYPHYPELGLKLARHLTIFSWLLKNFLRGRKVTGDDADLIRTMLPHGPDADYVMRQRKMPVAVVMRLRQALAHLSHAKALTTAEEIAIDHTIQVRVGFACLCVCRFVLFAIV